jgi:hypothetical protein
LNCAASAADSGARKSRSAPSTARAAADGVAAGIGELDGVLAPVIRVLAPHDQPLVLQVVDQRDHGGAVDVHRPGDLPLRDRVPVGDGPQHGGLSVVDPDWTEHARAELEEALLHVLEQVPQMCVWTIGGHESQPMNRLIVSDTDDQ